MKIHMRPPVLPLPPAPQPKAPPTAFQLAMQGEELIKTAQQQRTRLKKLYGAWKSSEDLDDGTDTEADERDRDPKQNLDFLA
jgi:hypothetical protein